MKIYQRTFDIDANDSLAIIARAIDEDKRVLDVGCGVGDLGAYLREQKNCHVAGLEYSKESLAIAKTKLDLAIEADLERTALTQLFDDSYDVIVFADILEHIRNPDAVLNDAQSLLSADGKLLISIPNAGYVGALLSLYDDEWEYHAEGILDTTHVRFYTKKSILSLLNRCGYDAVIHERVCKDLTESDFTQRIDCLTPSVRDWLMAKSEGATYQFIIEARPQSQRYAFSPEPIEPTMALLHILKLYWQDQQTDFTDEKYQMARGVMGQDNTLSFELDAHQLQKIRLDFADRRGYYQIKDIQIHDPTANKLLWSARQSQTPFKTINSVATDSHFPANIHAVDNQAQLILDLPEIIANPNLAIVVQLHAPISEQSLAFVDVIPASQYNDLKSQLDESIRYNTHLKIDCEQLNHALDEALKNIQVINEERQTLARELQNTIDDVQNQLREAQQEIERIYQSSSWKLTAPLRKLKNLKK